VLLKARPAELEIDPSQAALVVVDMQNSFVSPGGMFDLAGLDISGCPDVIDVNFRLIEASHQVGLKVVYLQMTYKPDLSDGGDSASPNFHKELGLVMMREHAELDGTLLVENTWDWKIVDDLTPRQGDLVVKKNRYSGFCNTDLAEKLRSENIRYLFFTGVATNICVESTARDAYFEEFWPILIEDAMNHAGPEFNRQATLWNFEHIFGWVTDSGQLLRALVPVPD